MARARRRLRSATCRRPPTVCIVLRASAGCLAASSGHALAGHTSTTLSSTAAQVAAFEGVPAGVRLTINHDYGLVVDPAQVFDGQEFQAKHAAK